MRFLLYIASGCASILLYATSALAQPVQPKAYCTQEERAAYIPANQRLNTLTHMVTLYHCNVNKPSYLLGTLHSDAPIVRKKLGYAFDTVSHVDKAFFEIITDNKTNVDIISHIVLPTDTTKTLSDILGETLYVQVRDIIRQNHEGFPDAVLQRYRPWATTMLMEFPAPRKGGVVLDEMLQNHAKSQKIALQGIETVHEQFAPFEALNEKQVITFVSDTASNITAVRELNKELENAYIAGDLPALQNIAKRGFFEITDPQLRAQLITNIVTKRNHVMAQRILPELMQGNRFVGVGILHLIGPEGLFELLEAEGFAIYSTSDK